MMPRKAAIDTASMSDFSRWLLKRLEQRGSTLTDVAHNAGINLSYLHKIMKSYLPQYRQYKRLSFEKTVQIGEYLGDVGGALRAAGHSDSYQAATVGDLTLRPQPFHQIPGITGRAGDLNPTLAEDGSDEYLEQAEEWPPELLEAMHYSRTLDSETQRYIYALWREQARVYAAVNQGARTVEEGTKGNDPPTSE